MKITWLVIRTIAQTTGPIRILTENTHIDPCLHLWESGPWNNASVCKDMCIKDVYGKILVGKIRKKYNSKCKGIPSKPRSIIQLLTRLRTDPVSLFRKAVVRSTGSEDRQPGFRSRSHHLQTVLLDPLAITLLFGKVGIAIMPVV